MKYTAFFASAVLFLLCSCATTSSTRFRVNPNSTNYPAGSADAQSDKLFSGEVRKLDFTVSYYPEEDAVCLRYRINFITYYQFWSRTGRETFKNALERYKFDYEQRSLNDKGGMRKRYVYGTANGFLGWRVMELLQIISGTVTGPCKIDMGYSFQGKKGNRTPYFTLTQNETVSHDREGGTRKERSEKVMLFFTRAQADELAALFDQDYLLSLEAEKPAVSGEAEVDEY